MNLAGRLLMALIATMSAVILLHACADGGDDDDDDCGEIVSDPLTDCETMCNDETCAIVVECEDYINGGAPEDCVNECFKGCEKGCVPVGAVECVEKFTDCESLVNCLDPLFAL